MSQEMKADVYITRVQVCKTHDLVTRVHAPGVVEHIAISLLTSLK